MLFGMGSLEPGAQCLELLESLAYLGSRDSQEAVHGVDTDLLLHHESEDGGVQEAIFVEWGRLNRQELPRTLGHNFFCFISRRPSMFLFFKGVAYTRESLLEKII